jgi:hypothetical protein
MLDRAQARSMLQQMDDQEPFRPFDIVTGEGSVVHVDRRFGFAFNQAYVVVTSDQGDIKRVRFEQIERIETIRQGA